MIYRESVTVEYDSEAFNITVFATDSAVVGIFRGRCENIAPNVITADAVKQISEYFDKSRREFDFPVDLTFNPDVTPFRLSVWRELMQIPYGEGVTYSELACRIGRPSSARAVGGAVGKNPLLLVVPCHRVLARDGVGGFSAGVDLKTCLLDLEGVAL